MLCWLNHMCYNFLKTLKEVSITKNSELVPVKINEFQEKLMRDVLAIDDYLLNGKGFPYNVEGVVSDSYTYENDQKDWLTFLLSITDDNGVISLKEWESGVNEYVCSYKVWSIS